MEDDIYDSLEDLGYTGELSQKGGGLEKAIEGGAKSVEFTQLVEWLSKELKVTCKLEDHVNAITSSEDSSSFLLEVSSFLKELNCPHQSLIEGSVSQRLTTKESRWQMLDFLCTELQAARMITIKQPTQAKGMKVELQESDTAADLKSLLINLGFPKPPVNIAATQLFAKVETKVQDLLKKIPAKLLSKPFFIGTLTRDQWTELDATNESLLKEYRLRREMLLKRLDVTIQSFRWSDRAKSKENQIAGAYFPKRKMMIMEPNVTLACLLAAREDIGIIEKTSSASVRKNTQSLLNKIIIGSVPDRGGRTSEQQPPPPEMPSWQKRTDGPTGRGGGQGGGGGNGDRGGRRGGGDRGRGRVQGSWSGGRGGGQDKQGGGQTTGHWGGQQQQQQQPAGGNWGAQYDGRAVAQQGSYIGQQAGYGGQQVGYGAQQGGYVAQQAGYGAQQGGYGAQQASYGAQQGGYVGQQGGGYGGGEHGAHYSGNDDGRGGGRRTGRGGNRGRGRGGQQYQQSHGNQMYTEGGSAHYGYGYDVGGYQR